MEYNPKYTNGMYDGQQGEFTWLDYTILKNPNGIMTVLARYGYIGYLAPQDTSELHEATRMLIREHEDRAIIDLLRVHPDYDVIKETPTEGYYTKNELFSNFAENNTTEKKKTGFNTVILIGGVLIIAALLIN